MTSQTYRPLPRPAGPHEPPPRGAPVSAQIERRRASGAPGASGASGASGAEPTSGVDRLGTRTGFDSRWALGALLAATGLLYLWGLGESGWANSFYAAAAQAGSESWKAFFFGSSDAANSITVDKTPLALWPMALSVRIFGLSSWSLLVPQALEGVAAVAVLHATVRRATGSAAAGLLAGAILALTPVAVLMFRFNNPDALLVLLLVGSAYATLRAVEVAPDHTSAAVRWLAHGGALVGLAFLTKMLQAFLALPPLALVYLLFAAIPVRRRIWHLLVALGSMLVAGGWWVAAVELWPASSRPWIGGSQHNSILELTLGYNGFGRLTGDETGSVGGGGGWGSTGILRMFNSEIGSQVAWLLPAALVLGGAGLWFTRGGHDAARQRLLRAGLVLWLGWLLVTALTFSFMAGIFHAYYTVALAPAIAALVATGGLVLWRHRASLVASGVLAFSTALTSSFAFALLDRTDWQPWLKYVVATLGFASALMLAGVRHLPRRVGQGVAVTALLASLAGPAAYSIATAATPHTGAIPSAGPVTASGGFGPPGGGPGDAGGGAGSLLNGSTSTATITAMLQSDAQTYTWAAAAVGSNSASGYQLASGEPVMAIGGFNGSDPSPTLAEFQTYVADREIHYFVGGSDTGGPAGGPAGGPGGAPPGGTGDTGSGSAIATWVADNFTATTVDGVTVYDLSGGVQ